MMDPGVVKLDDIVTNSGTKMYCAFSKKIWNKNNPYYEIYNSCGARIYPGAD